MLYHSGCLILPFFKQNYPLLKPESQSSLNNFASIWCCIEDAVMNHQHEYTARDELHINKW